MTENQSIKIQSNEEYEQSMRRINEIFTAKTGSPESYELLLLVTAVEEYEKIHFPME